MLGVPGLDRQVNSDTLPLGDSVLSGGEFSSLGVMYCGTP